MKQYLHLVVVILCILSFASCAPTRFAGMSKRAIRDKNEQNHIIATHYPNLVEYLHEGVLYVQKLNEYTSSDGSHYYDIKYKFISRYISDYDEAMAQLRQMPELHQLYINGKIKINHIKVYVNEKGEIRYNVNYTYISNLYRPVFIPY